MTSDVECIAAAGEQPRHTSHQHPVLAKVLLGKPGLWSSSSAIEGPQSL